VAVLVARRVEKNVGPDQNSLPFTWDKPAREIRIALVNYIGESKARDDRLPAKRAARFSSMPAVRKLLALRVPKDDHWQNGLS
jgi:hypothetical protein